MDTFIKLKVKVKENYIKSRDLRINLKNITMNLVKYNFF